MPSIKRNDEQQKALATITESLDYLTGLAQVAKGEGGDATISFDTGKRGPRNKCVKFTVQANDKDMKKLLRILLDSGKRESKNIESLAKQFDIELSREEAQLVSTFNGATKLLESYEPVKEMEEDEEDSEIEEEEALDDVYPEPEATNVGAYGQNATEAIPVPPAGGYYYQG